MTPEETEEQRISSGSVNRRTDIFPRGVRHVLGGESQPTLKGVTAGNGVTVTNLDREIFKHLNLWFPSSAGGARLFTLAAPKRLINGSIAQYVGIDRSNELSELGEEFTNTEIFYTRGRRIEDLCGVNIVIEAKGQKTTLIWETGNGVKTLKPEDGRLFEDVLLRIVALMNSLDISCSTILSADDPLTSVFGGPSTLGGAQLQ